MVPMAPSATMTPAGQLVAELLGAASDYIAHERDNRYGSSYQNMGGRRTRGVPQGPSEAGGSRQSQAAAQYRRVAGVYILSRTGSLNKELPDKEKSVANREVSRRSMFGASAPGAASAAAAALADPGQAAAQAVGVEKAQIYPTSPSRK